MDTRDISIYTQVAFKEAMARNPQADLYDEGQRAMLTAETVALTEVLVDAINMNRETYAVAAVQQAFQGSTTVPQPNAAPAAATQPADGEWVVEVANPSEQQGPLPEWLIEKCREKGIRRVWDQRNSAAANPSKNWPIFREFVPKAEADAGKKAQAWWPPK